MLVLLTDSDDDWLDEKTGWDDWVGRKKTLLILIICACCKFMCNKHKKNIFNAFL